MGERMHYLTDDRDLPLEDQRTLVIFPGGNGDWYVQVGDHRGRAVTGVRLCTSGGASTQVPGLTVAIADAYRALAAARAGHGTSPASRHELEEEIQAWRERFPRLEHQFGEIVDRDPDQVGAAHG